MVSQILSKKAIAPDGTLTKRKFSKVKVNFFLDLFLTVLFVVEMEEHFTGLALHEVLGLLFAAAFGLHIILHWDWIISLTRSFTKKFWHESRLNYVLNVVLFVDMLFVTLSGLLISRTLGLNLALGQDTQQTLQKLHLIGSELVLIIVALHVAMHWKWIKTHTAKYLLGGLSSKWVKRESRGPSTTLPARKKNAWGMASFILLTLTTLLLGAALRSQNDLISPLQNTHLLLNTSEQADFGMVSEGATTRNASANTASSSEGATVTVEAETVTTVETPVLTSPSAAVNPTAITMEQFVTELSAAGVDMEAVTATMTAEGRSLDNLLAVVNSGRVTVADLALRLKGEAPTSISTAPQKQQNSLLDIRWDELGSVIFDLWFILAVTVILIVLARPVGWLVSRIKGTSGASVV